MFSIAGVAAKRTLRPWLAPKNAMNLCFEHGGCWFSPLYNEGITRVHLLSSPTLALGYDHIEQKYRSILGTEHRFEGSWTVVHPTLFPIVRIQVHVSVSMNNNAVPQSLNCGCQNGGRHPGVKSIIAQPYYSDPVVFPDLDTRQRGGSTTSELFWIK